MAFASDTAVTHRVVATSGRRNARTSADLLLLPGVAVAAAVDLGVAVADARVQRLSQRTLHVAFPTAVVGRSLRPGRVVQRIETGEQAEAVAVIAVRARREPRVEDRVHDARVELVHDRDGVALLVAAGPAAVPAVRPGHRGAPERVGGPAQQDAQHLLLRR